MKTRATDFGRADVRRATSFEAADTITFARTDGVAINLSELNRQAEKLTPLLATHDFCRGVEAACAIIAERGQRHGITHAIQPDLTIAEIRERLLP